MSHENILTFHFILIFATTTKDKLGQRYRTFHQSQPRVPTNIQSQQPQQCPSHPQPSKQAPTSWPPSAPPPAAQTSPSDPVSEIRFKRHFSKSLFLYLYLDQISASCDATDFLSFGLRCAYASTYSMVASPPPQSPPPPKYVVLPQ